MSNTSLNIELAKATFSTLRHAVVITPQEIASHYIPIFGLGNAPAKDEPDGYSPLGTPVYGRLTLGNTDPNIQPQNQYTGIDGNTYTFDSLDIDIAIVTLNLKKNVVKTAIQGRDGKIKEYIGLDDYDITINGIFNSKGSGIAPKTDMALLQQIVTAPISLPVTHYLLAMYRIKNIVIEDVSFPQQAGSYASQAFTITACSDIPLTEFCP